MVREWLASNSLSWAYGKLLDQPYNKVIHNMDQKQLAQLTAEYNQRMKQQLETVVLQDELDFGGLEAFVKENLQGDIVNSVLEPEIASRARKRERVRQAACAAARADHEAKKQWVERYLEVLFGFIEVIAGQHVDDSTKVLVNSAIDHLDEKHSDAERQLRRDICELQRQEQRSPFADMIECIGAKPESTNEFHYLNGKIGFWGREKEMEALDAFLKDERKVLFLSIIAPGASGKSKLVYEFVKQHSDDGCWEMKYIRKPQMERLLSFDDFSYHKNLVFIVDYAGLYAKNLGEWLYHLLSLEANAFPQKIRLILLERGGMAQTEALPMEAKWKRELLGSGEQRASLKSICYQASCFGPDGELRPLKAESLRQIMRQYAEHRGRVLSEKELDQLMTCLAQIDSPPKAAPRPLFALLTAEAYVNRSAVHRWDTNAMLEHCIARTEQQWKDLCGGDPALYSAIQEMVLYATATERLALDDLPEMLTEAGRQLNRLDDEAYVSLICGVNQDMQYQNVLYPLEPDLVGEYYLLQSLMKAACRRERLRARTAGYWLKTENFFEVFARCIHDYGHDPVIKRFLREHAELLLPPDRNELEVEAHSRLLHLMMIQCKGKTNQNAFAARLKALYEKYPHHKVVINDYAASLMLEFRNHIGRCWEQEENVRKIEQLLAADPESYYLLALYGKSIFNQISGYVQYLWHVDDHGEAWTEGTRRIAAYYGRLRELVERHPGHELLRQSLGNASGAMAAYTAVKRLGKDS